jgi:MFS family permease
MSDPAPIVYRRFPALRSRDFRLLWLGQMVSMAGSQMQFWALNWHLYTLTHSAVALGMIGLARVVPIAIFSLVGGTVADALDRRKLMLITQSVMMATAVLLGVLTMRGELTAGVIYALSALAAGALAFDNPARQALLPNLVPREHFANAVSLHTIIRQVATIVGPPLAGFLIASGGLAFTYWLNALSFLAVIGALLLVRAGGGRAGGSVDLAALREALAFLRQSPVLLSTMVLDFLATFFSSANALLPIFAKDVLHVGPKGYGVLAAAPAVGSLLTGGALAFLPRIRRQGPVVLWAVVAYGAATILFGASRWYTLSLLALAGTGAADTISTVVRQTIRQLNTPDRLRGRISAATMVFFMGGPQLGELEAGLVAAWVGAPLSVALGGLGCLVSVALVAWRVPCLRAYDGEHGSAPLDEGSKA